GANRMPELPSSALDNFADLIGHERRLRWILERRDKQMSETLLLRVRRRLRRLLQSPRHRRLDNARFHHCHSHIERLHLLGKRLTKRLQGKFRGGVRSERRIGDASRNRGYVDDASAPPLTHLRRDGLNAAQRTEVIRLHHGAEIRYGKLFDRSVTLHACVVDEHVDSACFLLDLGNRRLHRSVRIDVHYRDSDRKLLLRSSLAKLGCARGIAHGGEDAVASPAKRERSCQANSCAGSGDEY